VSYGTIRTTSGLFADTVTTSGGILAFGTSGLIATTITSISGIVSYGTIRTTSGLFADTVTTSGGILAFGTSGLIATTITSTSGILGYGTSGIIATTITSTSGILALGPIKTNNALYTSTSGIYTSGLLRLNQVSESVATNSTSTTSISISLVNGSLFYFTTTVSSLASLTATIPTDYIVSNSCVTFTCIYIGSLATTYPSYIPSGGLTINGTASIPIIFNGGTPSVSAYYRIIQTFTLLFTGTTVSTTNPIVFSSVNGYS
jgi:hypothetical protein